MMASVSTNNSSSSNNQGCADDGDGKEQVVPPAGEAHEEALSPATWWGEAVEEALACPICVDVLRDAVETPCCHATYCRLVPPTATTTPHHHHTYAWPMLVWCGVVWCGVVWCGVVWWWRGVVWCGVVVAYISTAQGVR
jgi:hypothetical protein